MDISDFFSEPPSGNMSNLSETDDSVVAGSGTTANTVPSSTATVPSHTAAGNKAIYVCMYFRLWFCGQ